MVSKADRSAKVQILLDINEPEKQLFTVTIKFTPTSEIQLISLPSWTPGSYTIRDYSQYLHNIRVFTDANQVTIKKNSVNQWQFQSCPKTLHIIKYTIEAHEFTVRSSYADNQLVSLCLPSCIMLINGFRSAHYTLTVNIPPSWKLFTPLDGSNPFSADSYDQLVDAPIAAGVLTKKIFKVKELNHHIITLSNTDNKCPKTLLIDLKLICETTCKLLNKSPASDYMFFLFLVDQGYGGLEHDRSCVMQYPYNNLSNKDGHKKLSQLLAHEYLHQWNVRKLRPREYVRYDYNQIVMSEALWFAEGVTSYFDLIIPYLAGITTLTDLLLDLSDELSYYIRVPGTSYQSLAESSKDAWIKLYKSNPVSFNYHISYYKVGLLVSLLLDISLRKYNHSLSRLLTTMIEKYSCSGGYTNHDILHEVSIVDECLSRQLSNWIYKCNKLPYEEILNEIGISVEPHPEEAKFTGIKFQEVNNSIYISSIHHDSPFISSGLAMNDELIAIDNCRITTIKQLESILTIDKKFEITYARRGIISRLKFQNSVFLTQRYELKVIKNADTSRNKLRNSWLQFY